MSRKINKCLAINRLKTCFFFAHWINRAFKWALSVSLSLRMKTAGFSIVRNALKYDYPVVESIRSVLPLVDAFYVGVGQSEDNTLELIKGLNEPKIHVIETVWDDDLRTGGQVLAIETNKIFDSIPAEFDWCFYIQADEVVHEKDYNEIQKQMLLYVENKQVEGLLFRYVHFYGTYDYVGDSRIWYRNEIRIVRNDKNIRSYKDAQGFRKKDDSKLTVKAIDASIYHYGWVKHPAKQKEKEKNFHKMWHDDAWMKENVKEEDEFNYSKIDSLKKFTGTHPAIMLERIAAKNWNFEYDPAKAKVKFKNRVLMIIEKVTGKRLFEYRNYRKI